MISRIRSRLSHDAMSLSSPKKSSWALFFGYVLLCLSLIILDQSTKLHAEANYMVSYHDTDLRSYRSGQMKVFTLGVSPSLVGEQNLEMSDLTKNWLDFQLTYVRNPGAAWGSFSNMPEPYRLWAFYGVTLLATVLIAYLFKTSEAGLRVTRTALVFIFAGAMGNFVDRVMLNYVIDWLQFHWKIWGWEYSFPVFNVADIAINIGLGLMILDMIINEILSRRKKIPVLQDSSVA